jgi:uncharacterized membrane protein HdeD (DUF308 family)
MLLLEQHIVHRPELALRPGRPGCPCRSFALGCIVLSGKCSHTEVCKMDGASLLLIRGIVGVVIGIVAFAWPGVTLAALVMIFGIYALIDGVTNLMLGLTKRTGHGRGWVHALQGLIGIAAGVLTFIWPAMTALALIFFIGAWAVVTGIIEVAAAIKLRKEITGEWLLALSGLLSIAFGVLVLAFPFAGAVGISWVLGSYAMLGGIILIALGVRLRSAVAVMA